MGNCAVILGVLLFLLLHLIQPGKPLRLRVTGLIFGASLLIGSFALNVVLPVERSWPASRTARLSVSLHRELKEIMAARPSTILLLEGGSHTAYGVDGNLLEAELEQRGVSAGVLQLSFGGANVFSRIAVMEAFLNRLSEAEEAFLNRSRLILLHEVHLNYDEFPLYRVAMTGEGNEQDTSTFSLEQTVRAWQALRERDQDNMQALIRLLQHLNAHNFRLGVLGQEEFWSEQRELAGHTPKPGKPLREMQADLGTAALAISKPPSRIDVPEWVRWRNQWMRHDALDGMADEEWFQAPPTLQPHMWSYESSMARQNPENMVIRGFHILPELLKPELWNDAGHLSGEGAKRYTRWLASQISAKLAPRHP